MPEEVEVLDELQELRAAMATPVPASRGSAASAAPPPSPYEPQWQRVTSQVEEGRDLQIASTRSS